MLRKRERTLKRTVAVILLIVFCLTFTSCGKIPTDKFLEILDDDIEATRIDLDDLNTLSDVTSLDGGMLAQGVYLTEDFEDIEDRFPDEVQMVVDYADEHFDLDIDTDLITNGTLYFRKSEQNDEFTAMLHIQFESRHAANSIIQGMIASARVGGGDPDDNHVSASDIKKITKDELYYNLISRGHILVHCDKRVVGNIVQDCLDEILDEKLADYSSVLRRVIRSAAIDYVDEHYPQYLDSDAVVGIYYEYDSIMIVMGFTCDGELEDIETFCEQADLGDPMEAKNSHLLIEFATKFLTGRLKSIIYILVEEAWEHRSDIIGHFL